MVGPLANVTRLSVEATSPLLIHGDVSPGLGAPTTHAVSPASGAAPERAGWRSTGTPAGPVVGHAVVGIETEQHEVGGRVATDDLRLVHDAVGGGHVDLGRVPDEPVAREDLAGPANADARAAPSAVAIVRADCHDRVSDGDRNAFAAAIGVLVGTTSGSESWSEGPPSADGAEHGERQDRPGGAGHERGGPHRLRA